MKMIVGLGNPGSEYEKTRHNTGFMALDRYAEKKNVSIEKKKMNSLYGEFNHCGEKIILLKPQGYINLSGEVIQKYMSFFKIDISDVLILCDDMDLEVGTFKIRYKGGSAGHNGLKNIETHFKTKEYKRIKIGISKNQNIDMVNYVIGKFSKEQFEKLESVLTQIPAILDDYLEMSFDNLMNKYNR